LTVNFDLSNQNFNPLTPYHLAYLRLIGVSPTDFYYNMEVADILTHVNDVIGGCTTMTSGYTQNTLKLLIFSLNNAHVNCSCQGQNGHPHLFDCGDPDRGMMRVLIYPENGSCLNDLTASIIAWPEGGTRPFTYMWSNNSTSNSITNLADGTYTVTITDANNQTATAVANVRSSTNICCNVAGNTFPLYPDNSNIQSSMSYDVNFLPNETVEFYETLTLSNNTLHIMEGIQFKVKSGTTLTLDNCVLSACGSMWKGITVDAGATLYLRNTTIKDAEYGVYAMDGANVYVSDSYFENNLVGIETQGNDEAAFNNIDFSLTGSTFTFNNALKDPYPNQLQYGTKPKAGIIFNNMLGTIGDESHSENIFTDMNCGIIADASILLIRNSRFQNIADEGYYPELYMGSGVACRGGGGAYSVDVKPFANQTSTNPTFDKCDYGVYGDDLSVHVEDCNMDSVGVGIYATGCGLSDQVIIYNNNISALYAGIQFYFNEGTDKLYSGFNNIVTLGNGGTCIGVYESGSGINSLIIEENTLYASGSLYGIDLNACENSIVYHNTIYETTPGSIRFTGINISGCKNPLISCNIVNGMTTGANHGSYGIKVNVTDNAVLHCNTVDQTTYGISFSGPCITENNIKDNEMNEHFEGLHLNSNAVIGVQESCGNRWLGPFLSGFGANNLNTTADGLSASQFIVHTDSVTEYYPSLPAYDSAWFVTVSGSSPYSCTALNECPDRTTALSADLDPDSLDFYISYNYWLSEEFIPETQSILHPCLIQVNLYMISTPHTLIRQ
jgi:hypothetical protein